MAGRDNLEFGWCGSRESGSFPDQRFAEEVIRLVLIVAGVKTFATTHTIAEVAP